MKTTIQTPILNRPSKIDKILAFSCAVLFGFLVLLIAVTGVSAAQVEDHLIKRFPYNCNHNYTNQVRPQFPGTNEPNSVYKIKFNYNQTFKNVSKNSSKINFNFSSLNHCERIINHNGISMKALSDYKKVIDQMTPIIREMNGKLTSIQNIDQYYTVSQSVSNPIEELSYGELKAYGPRVELKLGAISLRSGFSTDFEDYKGMDTSFGSAMIVNNFRTGVGIQVGSAKLEYDLNQHKSDLGMKHKIALTVFWGGDRS